MNLHDVTASKWAEYSETANGSRNRHKQIRDGPESTFEKFRIGIQNFVTPELMSESELKFLKTPASVSESESKIS